MKLADAFELPMEIFTCTVVMYNYVLGIYSCLCA